MDLNSAQDKNLREPSPIRNIVEDCLANIQRRHENRGSLLGLSTGFDDIDALTEGFRLVLMILTH